MPFDGIVTAATIYELSGLLENGRIEKIFQTEKDEIVLLCHAGGDKYRLLLSASPVNPRIHLTKSKKENPDSPPPFCMVLRKHLQSSHISKIYQNGYDRIVTIETDKLDELGDKITKKLIIEIMGRHSNIILTGPTGIIYDSIKHVDNQISRVREVMPARHYILPPKQDKINPNDEEGIKKLFIDNSTLDIRVDKFILDNISGFSPLLSRFICKKANIPNTTKIETIVNTEKWDMLRDVLLETCNDIAQNKFSPVMILNNESGELTKPIDFHCLNIADNGNKKSYDTVNLLLDDYYTTTDFADRLIQKKASVAKNVSVAIDRLRRKLQLQEETLQNSTDFDDSRIEAELITANLYRIKDGDCEISVENYYLDPPKTITISLDTKISAARQAQQLFKKYHKMKASYDNALEHIKETRYELEYLLSVEQLLRTCTVSQEIDEIKTELSEQGFIRFGNMARKHDTSKEVSEPKISARVNFPGKPGKNKSNWVNKKLKKPVCESEDKKIVSSKPMKFITSDGYEVFVGKNNKQNETLTLRTAAPNDLWLHTKNTPGSHVVIRTGEHGGTASDIAIKEAAEYAAFYSGASNSTHVEVDYTNAKNVRKMPGGRPGMVNYVNYKTINVEPKKSGD